MKLPYIHRTKLNEHGDHVVLIVAFIVLFGIAGTYFLVNEFAASVTVYRLGVKNTSIYNANLCMDNRADSSAVENPVITYPCNNNDEAQQWQAVSVAGGFWLKDSAGTCIDDWNGLVGSSPLTRRPLVTNTCYKNDNHQVWHKLGSELVSASGGCINDTGASTKSGTQLIVYTCSNQANEAWTPTTVNVGTSTGPSGATAADECRIYGYGTMACNDVHDGYNYVAAHYSGWNNSTQLVCLVEIWNKESGWIYTAENPSGAYGIPQALPGSKMRSAGADWVTDPVTQIDWGLGYIKSTYSTPCSAWAFEVANGYY